MTRKATITPRNNQGQFTGNYSTSSVASLGTAITRNWDTILKNWECWNCETVYNSVENEKCPKCGADHIPF